MQNLMAAVLENTPLAPGLRRLVLSVPKMFSEEVGGNIFNAETSDFKKLRPGMFVHAAVVDAPDRLLRRPIGLMDADFMNETITLAIQAKGEGTCKLCSVATGNTIDILVPAGNGFDPKDAGTVWLAGGGVGVAPLLFAAKCYAPHYKLRAFLGFRCRESVFADSEISHYCHTTLCTDDGSAGFHGTVVDAMEKALCTDDLVPDLVLACGPTPMLKGVQSFCLSHGISGQLSLEQRMGCGYGACLTCACKVRGTSGISFERVCADGPVFDAERVVL